MKAAKEGRQVLIEQLQSLWSAEAMLADNLPRIIGKVSNPGLKKTMAHHFSETLQHKTAIEAICKQLNINTQGIGNEAMQSILKEVEKAMANESSNDELDALIIVGAKKIEEYEIQSYPVAADYAEALGYEGIAARLRLTLEEEKQAETKLKFLEKVLVLKTATIGTEV